MIKFCKWCGNGFEPQTHDFEGCPIVGCNGALVDLDELMYPAVKAFVSKGYKIFNVEGPHLGRSPFDLSLTLDLSPNSYNFDEKVVLERIESLVYAMLIYSDTSTDKDQPFSLRIEAVGVARAMNINPKMYTSPDANVKGLLSDIKETITDKYGEGSSLHGVIIAAIKPLPFSPNQYFTCDITGINSMCNICKNLVQIANTLGGMVVVNESGSLAPRKQSDSKKKGEK